MIASIGHNLSTAHRIEALATLLCAIFFRDNIGAVEGIVEATPTGVTGVKCEACILNGHNQLRTGLLSNLSIDILGSNLEVVTFRHQVTDIGQELLVLDGVMGLTLALGVVGVDLGLQVIASRQQRLILGRQVINDFFKG